MTSIICVGDFGTGFKEQKYVSKLIEHLNEQKLCAFILGLGDNIYPDGVISVLDDKFITNFEDPYKNIPKHIKFYHCLGNHDYHGNVQAQIDYSNVCKSNRWVLPDNYYCFYGKVNNIDCDFFSIDTNLYFNNNKKTQKVHEEWLISQLKNSKRRWRIVYGHHPWKSSGTHGDCNELLDKFYQKISDTHKVDVILSGHDHDQQHIYIPNKPHLFISGTGGKIRHCDSEERFTKHPEYLKFFTEKLGCLQIIPHKNHLDVSIYTTNNKKNHKKAYSFKINKKD